ncbi:hypothetical protein [Providencia rettgeri]|uniref:hypothetical protein n=1 Tax=Providencia rettgeri TaxID=587 RepID=UPI0023AA6AE9|nr:hypothetical protein [Providencia rettgeri]
MSVSLFLTAIPAFIASAIWSRVKPKLTPNLAISFWQLLLLTHSLEPFSNPL